MDTKALRQKILDLAVRGKLVPQNPDDEPARVLLERIRAEKKQMVKDGRLKAKDIKNDSVIYFKEDNLPYEQFADGTEKCITDEIPFELPDGWEWTRLQNISVFELGKTLDKAKNKGQYKNYLCSINVKWNDIDLSEVKQMKFEDAELDRYRLKKNDLLICEGGDVGRCCIWDSNEEMYYQNALHRVRFYQNILPEIYMFIMMYYAYNGKFSEICKGVTIKHLTATTLKTLLFPLPPLSEQKRIAEKINELMGLVDVIEQNKTDLQTAVKLAKEKILDLAIRGQLVPQNPDDEPASVLLERIRAEKQQLIQQGKIKPDKKDTVTFTDDELPFELPDGWEWCRLGNLCSVISKGTTPKGGKSCYLDSGINYLRVENIMDNGQIDTSDMVHIDEKIHNTELKRSILQEDDLLITIAGTLGKTAVVHKNNLPLNTNQAISFSRLINVNLCFVDFLRLIISSKIIQNRLLLKTKVTSIPNLTLEIISDCLIPLPPLNEQKRIADKINQLFSMLDSITEFLN